MYTLQQAKQEIDEVAKHAMYIAAHAISMGESFDAKLEGFKREIIGVIETKFAELERTLVGDAHVNESTALADLGAKVSLLIHGAPQSSGHDAPMDQNPPFYNDQHHDAPHQQHHDAPMDQNPPFYDNDQHHNAPHEQHHDAPHNQHFGDHNNQQY